MKVVMLGPYPVDRPQPGAGPQQPGARAPLAGGVDAVVVALAGGLARYTDVELSVVTALPGLAEPVRCPAEGFALYGVPRPRGGRLFGQRPVVNHLVRRIRELRPDVVHAHSAGIFAGAALASGIPAVITLHGVIRREAAVAWPASSWPSRLRWQLDPRYEASVVRRARDIIAISPYILAEFQGRSRARFHVIENPVDDRFFETFTEQRPPGQSRLLYVGRVIPRKGILGLINAFALAHRRQERATLTIAGEMTADPAYAAQCRALADQLGLGAAVDFVGPLEPDAVRAQYAACDAVVLASLQETAPVTIGEALAAGRPVVTTDVGGCAAMVEDGKTGRVVPPNDPNALADAILELLADPQRCAAMGEAARASAATRFRLGAVAARTAALYRRIYDGREGA